MKPDFSKMTQDEIYTYCRTKAKINVKDKLENKINYIKLLRGVNTYAK